MNNIRNFINLKFKDFPLSEEVKLLKEEMYESLEVKYESLIKEGKTEQQAYHEVIDQFGDIHELKKEFGVNKNKNGMRLYSIFFILISVLYFMSLTYGDINSLFYGDTHLLIFTNVLILYKMFGNYDVKWYWVSLLFGGYLSIQVLPIGYLFLLIAAFTVYKFRLWRINMTVVSYIVMTISYLFAFNFNRINNMDILRYDKNWNQLNSLIIIEDILYVLTFLFSIYVIFIYMNYLSKKIKVDLFLVILVVILNSLFILISYNFIVYFALIPLIINLFIILKIKKLTKDQNINEINIKFINVFNYKYSLILCSTVIVSLFLLGMFMKSSYLFMPNELHKTHKYRDLTWRDLKNPVILEIVKSGKTVTITDKSEIKQLIKLLDEEKYLTTTKAEWEQLEHLNTDKRGKLYIIQIRNVKEQTKEDYIYGDFLYTIHFYENQTFIETNHSNYTFEKTDEIKAFIDLMSSSQ